MRWEGEAEEALARAGYDLNVEKAGVDDYQGWGVVMAQNKDGLFAVCSWSYGSCSYCDPYEDLAYGDAEPGALEKAFDENVEAGLSEADGRAKFEARKGW